MRKFLAVLVIIILIISASYCLFSSHHSGYIGSAEVVSDNLNANTNIESDDYDDPNIAGQ